MAKRIKTPDYEGEDRRVANGNNGWIWKVITAILIPAFFLLVNNVIANDKDARAREDKIKDTLVDVVKEQTQVNQAVLIKLTEIQRDISYIKLKTNKVK